MPKKTDRVTPLPAGLIPLLTMRQLETYYGVSDWTVLQWIEAGMPVELLRTAGAKNAQRRFDLDAVKRWHADNSALAATA
ncbi:hypothetical protein [Streptomyces niveus]|uniref:hypothetical protein n=1 Tax=Streptomyces niveus TaxID=193462 RepID=UPI00084BCAEF|nr:hypothetical protein [Streptomyces niveus]